MTEQQDRDEPREVETPCGRNIWTRGDGELDEHRAHCDDCTNVGQQDRDELARRIVPPLGWPFAPRVRVVRPAERQRRLLILNRYPRQVIGIALRLPSITDRMELSTCFGTSRPIHLSMSIVWSKPARWWK